MGGGEEGDTYTDDPEFREGAVLSLGGLDILGDLGCDLGGWEFAKELAQVLLLLLSIGGVPAL